MFNEKVRKALLRGYNVRACNCATCGRDLSPKEGIVVAITNSDYKIDCKECYHSVDSKGNYGIDLIAYTNTPKALNNDNISFQVSFNISNRLVDNNTLDIVRLLNKHNYKVVKVNQSSYKVTSKWIPNLNGLNKMVTSLVNNFKVSESIKVDLIAQQYMGREVTSECKLIDMVEALKDLRLKAIEY